MQKLPAVARPALHEREIPLTLSQLRGRDLTPEKFLGKPARRLGLWFLVFLQGIPTGFKTQTRFFGHGEPSILGCWWIVVYSFSRLPHQVVELHPPAFGHSSLDWWLSPLFSSLHRIAAFCQASIVCARALAGATKEAEPECPSRTDLLSHEELTKLWKFKSP